MVPLAPDAWPSRSIAAYSNRLSSNQSLCFRKTEFCAQRQRRRYASGSPSDRCRDKSRANNPAKSPPGTDSREISANVGVGGGRRSPVRTGLRLKFPGNRENYRENDELGAALGSPHLKKVLCDGHFLGDSLRNRTGNLERRIGKIFLPAGNSGIAARSRTYQLGACERHGALVGGVFLCWRILIRLIGTRLLQTEMPRLLSEAKRTYHGLQSQRSRHCLL